MDYGQSITPKPCGGSVSIKFFLLIQDCRFLTNKAVNPSVVSLTNYADNMT